MDHEVTVVLGQRHLDQQDAQNLLVCVGIDLGDQIVDQELASLSLGFHDERDRHKRSICVMSRRTMRPSFAGSYSHPLPRRRDPAGHGTLTAVDLVEQQSGRSMALVEDLMRCPSCGAGQGQDGRRSRSDLADPDRGPGPLGRFCGVLVCGGSCACGNVPTRYPEQGDGAGVPTLSGVKSIGAKVGDGARGGVGVTVPPQQIRAHAAKSGIVADQSGLPC